MHTKRNEYRRSVRWICCGLIGACLCVLFFSSLGAAKLVNRIVAVVNGEIITLHELKTEVQGGGPGIDQSGPESAQKSQDMQRRVLEAMINDKLIKQEAERFEIQVSDAEVDAQIEQIKKENNLSQDEFEQAVRDQGMTLDGYRQAMQEEIMKSRVLSNMVRQKVVVGEDEMRDYFEQHKEEYRQPQKVHLRIILHPDRGRLEKVRESIVSGDISFAEAAGSVSQGPGADQGGDLGVYAWKNLRPEWRDILNHLQPGEVSQVFSLQGNYAILALEEMTDEQTQSFESVKEEIRQKLYARKLEERFSDYIQGLREKAVIDVRLQDAS
ncbi:MAG: SurA N-terminal domain-containing protein [Desulfovermiculus sp.]|nr:SurA N-terminal domain-containing protein [Desulfovermiculus sp.]